jgi:AcrR family transcriptional regulator
MRTQDEEKKEALFEATVKMVNEIGFAYSSVSKIAKEAKVSPSTIYVYHKNKEELLVSTYIQIKQNMSGNLFENFDDTLPIRDIFKNIWFKWFEYASNKPEYLQFTEQFANSPYSDLVNRELVESYFAPIIEVGQKGIEQKIIKDVRLEFIAAFIFYPISHLANPKFCYDEELSEEDIETAFSMAWDAIKL